MDEFIIKNGKLERYNGSDENVIIPENVTRIGAFAFRGRKNLTSVVIPYGVTEIDYFAFGDCSSLIDITLPDSVTVIDEQAFSGCKSLTSINIPESVTKISGNVFYGCNNLTITLSDKKYSSGGKLSNQFVGKIKPSLKEIAYLLVHQTEKKWQNYISGFINKENVNEILGYCIEIFSGLKRVTAKKSDGTLTIVSVYKEHIDPDILNSLIDAMEMSGTLSARKKEEEKSKEELLKNLSVDAEKLAKGERPDEKEVIQFVEDYWKTYPILPNVSDNYAENKTIHYKNSNILCETKVIQAILNEYAFEFMNHSTELNFGMGSHRELVNGYDIRISTAADYIFKYLEEDEFYNVLQKLASSRNYRFFILAYARFIPDCEVPKFIDKIKREEKGNYKSRYWAENAHKALYINESVAAMQFFESKKELEFYANMRGMSAQDIRDMRMAPDFGFDADGVRRFAAGEIKLSARILPDTGIELSDENTGKVLKNIPRTGASSEELNQLKADFAEFKKTAKKYVKTKTENLCALHMNGNPIKLDVWEKVYLGNPLVKPLAYGLIWVDDNGISFIPSEQGLIKYDGTKYCTNTNVRLAHVIDMTHEEIESWQDYLSKNGIRQPFEQVWEPVVDAKRIDTTERYKGLHMTVQERNALKKTLKTKGIDVYSDSMEGEFNHRQWSYEFYTRNTMHLGEYISFDYKIEDDKSITIEKGYFKFDDVALRSINAVLYEFEKMMVRSDIEHDNDSDLTNERLSGFTLAQIVGFIDIASECSSTKCLAVLLNYKEQTYGVVDSFASFTLDLL